MNKILWPKLYAASKPKVSKVSISTTRPIIIAIASVPKTIATIYASAARAAPHIPPNVVTPSPSTWSEPSPTRLANEQAPIHVDAPTTWTMATANPSDLFYSLLDDKSTDPQALAVQNYLTNFISRSVQRSHGDKMQDFLKITVFLNT